jgi:hypothetical protein
MSSPVMVTRSGVLLDLTAPRADQIRWSEDVALALACLPRFNGHAGDGAGRCWSVGEHSVAGADLLRAATGSARLALLFLLHDAHEAYMGDISSPAAAAIALHADREFDVKAGYRPGDSVRSGIKALKLALDSALFAAAGAAPPTPEERRLIALHDARMLRAELTQIMGLPEARLAPELRRLQPLRMTGALKPAGKPLRTADAFLERLDRWAPAARPRATADALAPFAAPRPARAL